MPPLLPRVRPDPDDVLLGALRAALYVPTPGRGDRFADVAHERADGWLERLRIRPLVVARTITADAGETGGQMVRHVSYAEVDVQCWALERRDASDLDDAALAALRAAWRAGTAHGAGRIARVAIQALGSEVPDPANAGRGVRRWQAGYRLTIRPA